MWINFEPVFFSVIDRIVFEMKAGSHFGQNVWTHGLMNTVSASFNTTETNDRNASVTKMSLKITKNVSAKITISFEHITVHLGQT